VTETTRTADTIRSTPATGDTPEHAAATAGAAPARLAGGTIPPVTATGGAQADAARAGAAGGSASDRAYGAPAFEPPRVASPLGMARHLRLQAECLEEHLRDQLELRRDHAVVAGVVDAVSSLSRVLTGGNRRGSGAAPAAPARTFAQLHAEVRAVLAELRALEAALAGARDAAAGAALVPIGRRLARAWQETAARSDRQIASSETMVTGLQVVIATCVFIETTIGTAGGAAIAAAAGGSTLVGAGLGAGATAAAFKLTTDAATAVAGADGRPIEWGTLLTTAGREGVSALAGVLIGGSLAPALLRTVGAKLVPMLDPAAATAIARAIGAGRELSPNVFAQLGQRLLSDVLLGAASTPFLVALDLVLHGKLDALTSPETFVTVLTDALVQGGLVQLMLSVALHGHGAVRTAAARRAPVASTVHAPPPAAPAPMAQPVAQPRPPVGADPVRVSVPGAAQNEELARIALAEQLESATIELSMALRAGSVRDVARHGDALVPGALPAGVRAIDGEAAQSPTLRETIAAFIHEAHSILDARKARAFLEVNESPASFRLTAEGTIVWDGPFRAPPSLTAEAAQQLVERAAGAAEIAGIRERVTAAGFTVRPDLATEVNGATRWRLAVDDGPGATGGTIRALRDGPAPGGGAGPRDTSVYLDPIELRAHDAGGLAMLTENRILLGEETLLGRQHNALQHEAGHSTMSLRAAAGDASVEIAYRRIQISPSDAAQFPIGIYTKGFIFDELPRHTKDALVALRMADDARQVAERLVARGELATVAKAQQAAATLQSLADDRAGTARALGSAITSVLERARAGTFALRDPRGHPLTPEALAAIDAEHERQILVLMSGRDRIPRGAAELDRRIAEQFGVAAPPTGSAPALSLAAIGGDGAVTATTRVGDPSRGDLEQLALRFTGDEAAARAAHARATATGPELGPAVETLRAGVLDGTTRIRADAGHTVIENDRLRLSLPGALTPLEAVTHLGTLHTWLRANPSRTLSEHELSALSRRVGTGALD
jgi:hypothetical protein